jgi:DNA-binding transcriptional MerR regulator
MQDASTPDGPEGYSLADLGDLTGVSPRTVRYYIQQGLLPAAPRTGPGARYAEDSLRRLRFIRACQEDGWPLAKVRDHLERLSPDEVEAMLSAMAPQRPRREAGGGLRVAGSCDAAPSSGLAAPGVAAPDPEVGAPAPQDTLRAAEPNAALAYLAQLRGSGAGSGGAPGAGPPAMGSQAPADAMRRPGPDPDLHRAPHPVRPDIRRAPHPVRPAALSRASWERIIIDTNLELHVRRPLSVADNRRLDRLLEAIERIYGLSP